MATLQAEAIEACKNRGHDMYDWYYQKVGRCISCCVHCKMEVQVIEDPAPNEIEIDGAAVALNCPGVRVWRD